ncbi:GlxA family transcriptional regulator [Janthinobacterium agaricidamnosum]|uniref:Bacterial regulatory helix-turn-helix s, AraC family protein n=1 Tax=Janthinobacterium agaricidamnosum NBRC 102515 = DSM 9628 TaxID=1349767 RepID=W0UWN6_9BURK|nr:GlxA family transcriptional regulator [Janthinobacterium agaricidamnosum]CDG80814.1 bacterial regulatory helix-turn-helix s, AraC family protein [Janthinobacterium agaricidamnosum NBRC 102515 = DSM 9628]
MKLTLVVLDGVQALDVAGPLDVFTEANYLLRKKDHYDITLVGGRPSSVMCSSGIEFKVHCHYLDFQAESDLLLVAGGPAYPAYQPEPAFIDWLKRHVQGAGRFGAVCNGVFLLGHAGLLAGREITTHWDHAQRLSAQFPAARVRPDKIFVRDGNLFTCGGVTAGIDLCLALIAEDWGHELAMKVAKRLIVYIRRDGGQSQYSPYLAVGPNQDSLVSKVLQYVTDHISDALTIEEIADAVGVSRRTFSRAFAKHAHVTPSIFVDQVRIDFARKLLEETDVPLKTVAFRCGFHTATQMRMIFARQLSTTPKLYRARFRAGDAASIANPDE